MPNRDQRFIAIAAIIQMIIVAILGYNRVRDSIRFTNETFDPSFLSQGAYILLSLVIFLLFIAASLGAWAQKTWGWSATVGLYVTFIFSIFMSTGVAMRVSDIDINAQFFWKPILLIIISIAALWFWFRAAIRSRFHLQLKSAILLTLVASIGFILLAVLIDYLQFRIMDHWISNIISNSV
jgi:hypothetical protein